MYNYDWLKGAVIPTEGDRRPSFLGSDLGLSLNGLSSLCSIEFEQSNGFLCSLPCKVHVVTVPFLED